MLVLRIQPRCYCCCCLPHLLSLLFTYWGERIEWVWDVPTLWACYRFTYCSRIAVAVACKYVPCWCIICIMLKVQSGTFRWMSMSGLRRCPTRMRCSIDVPLTVHLFFNMRNLFDRSYCDTFESNLSYTRLWSALMHVTGMATSPFCSRYFIVEHVVFGRSRDGTLLVSLGLIEFCSCLQMVSSGQIWLLVAAEKHISHNDKASAGHMFDNYFDSKTILFSMQRIWFCGRHWFCSDPDSQSSVKQSFNVSYRASRRPRCWHMLLDE